MADYVRGTKGNDVVDRSTSTDTVWIFGDEGDDLLTGGWGNDSLNGGMGSDRMQGGAGNDTFVFVKGEVSTGAGLDHVIDFQGAGVAGGDALRFEGFGAGTTLTYVRASSTGGGIYEIFDPTDGYRVQVLIQMADGASADSLMTARGDYAFV